MERTNSFSPTRFGHPSVRSGSQHAVSGGESGLLVFFSALSGAGSLRELQNTPLLPVALPPSLTLASTGPTQPACLAHAYSDLRLRPLPSISAGSVNVPHFSSQAPSR